MKNARTTYSAICIAIAVLASFVTHYSTIWSGFVADDYELIVTNPWITEIRDIPLIFSSHTMGYCETCPPISYRPMIFLIYIPLYALFNLNPAPYHLVNVVIHTLNAIAVFFMVRLLILRHSSSEGAPPGPLEGILPAFAASVLFATHPAGSEPVSWVSSIAELSYTLLGLISFILYVKGGEGGERREGGGYIRYTVLPSVMVLAALAFKETAIFLVPLFVIYDAVFSSRERPFTGSMKRHPPLVAALILYFIIRVTVLGGIVSPEKFHSYGGLTEAALNAFVLFWGFMKMLFFPVHLYPGEPFSPVSSFLDTRLIVSAVAAAAVAVLILVFRKRASRLYLLSFSMMALPVLPVLYAPAVSRAPLADRYIYFPLAGFALLTALLFKGAMGVRGSKRWRTAAALFGLAFFAALFSYWTSKKNLVWKDEVTYWSTQARAFPGNYFALYRTGKAYIRNGAPDEGIRYMEESVRENLLSRRPDAMVLLLSRRALAVEYRKKGMTDESIREYEEIVRISPEDISAIFNLASLYKESGMLADAIELFRRALAIAEEAWQKREIHNALGDSYSLKGDWRRALEEYYAALRISPDDPATLNKAANARRMLEGRE